MSKCIALFLITVSVFGVETAFAQSKAQRSRDIARFNLLRVWTVKKGHLYVKVKATIKKHWKLYSANMKKGGPVPTTFSFTSGNARVLAVYEWPRPRAEKDPNFDMVVKSHTRNVWFTLQAKAKKTLKKNTVQIKFMVCNEKTGICLPPDKVRVELKR